MGVILDKIRQFFDVDDWNYSQLEGETILRLGFSGDNGNWTIFAQAKEDAEQLIVYSLFPNNTPEDKRAEVAKFLHMANYGLIVGNFEFDYSDGEARFKSSVMAPAQDITNEMIRHLVYANVLTVDRYFPGLMGILYGGKTAEAAIKEIEG